MHLPLDFYKKIWYNIYSKNRKRCINGTDFKTATRSRYNTTKT